MLLLVSWYLLSVQPAERLAILLPKRKTKFIDVKKNRKLSIL